MSIILEQAGYTYPSGTRPAVEAVSLAIGPGEFVLLTGPTGCGKSTLLRLAAGLLQRHGQGTVQGSIRTCDTDPAALAPAARAGVLGFVSQEPGDQLVSATVGDEVAFAMASAGWPRERMDAAVDRLLHLVGLQVAQTRDTTALSGGQTQRLVVAAALAAEARVLLLDEPLAQLDPAGARNLLARIRDLADAGVAVLMVEHRIETCLPMVDRVVLMAGGRVVRDDPAPHWQNEGPGTAAAAALGLTLPGPVTLARVRTALGADEAELAAMLCARPPLAKHPPDSRILLAIAEACHTWPGTDAPALSNVSLALRAGERVALLGGNGAGKSTLLRMLSGQLGPGPDGPGRVVSVPQDPDLALFCDRVDSELAYGPQEAGWDTAEVQRRVRSAATMLSVEALLDRPPQALSRGQRLRVAVAAAMTCAPDVLLLDEPTSGQDQDQVSRMMAGLQEGMSAGALAFATHDVDLALRWATRAIVLHSGRVVAAGKPSDVLAGLPTDVPIVLPPLATWCRERGLPLLSTSDLAHLPWDA